MPKKAQAWLAVAAVAAGVVGLGLGRAAIAAEAEDGAEETSAESAVPASDAETTDGPGITVPPPPTYRFDEVLITATRVPEAAFDVPRTVNTVTDEQIQDRLYRTTPEALRTIPSIMIQKTAHGHGSPYIRGFTSFRNLMLIDGIRLNNSVFRPGPNQYWNTVDPGSIRRIEVVKGPSSVLYGSDAVGGTVNALTKGPRGYGEGFNYGGRLSYRIASAERSQIGRSELWATWDRKLGLYVGGSVKNFGDLESGGGVNTQHKTGYDEWDLDFKAEVFIRPTTRVVIGHQTVRQKEVPRTHKTVFSEPWEGLTVGSEFQRDLWQQRDLTYIQLHAEELDSWIDAARFSVSWQQQSELRRRLRPGKGRDSQGFLVDTVGFWTQLESDTPIGRLTYGAELYHDNVNSFKSGNPIQGPVGDDGSWDMLGLFLQDTIPVTDRLQVRLGGRWEHIRAKAGSVQDPMTGRRIRVSDDWSQLVGSGRVLYYLDEAKHWNVFGGVSQGFRAPNLSDLSRLDTARTNEIETPAPGLDPEHYLAYEVGVKSEYDDLGLQIAYWYTDIRDMIIRVPTGAVIGGNREVTKTNAGDGFVHGVDLAGSWRFHPQLTAFGAFSWMTGEVDTFPTSAPVEEREPLSRLMPTTTRVGLRWNHPKEPVWAEVEGVFADNQDDLSTRDAADTSRIPPGGTPSYEVLNLRTGWRVHTNVDLTFAIENVTDEAYRIHGSGLNEPGRNFVLGCEISF